MTVDITTAAAAAATTTTTTGIFNDLIVTYLVLCDAGPQHF